MLVLGSLYIFHTSRSICLFQLEAFLYLVVRLASSSVHNSWLAPEIPFGHDIRKTTMIFMPGT